MWHHVVGYGDTATDDRSQASQQQRHSARGSAPARQHDVGRRLAGIGRRRWWVAIGIGFTALLSSCGTHDAPVPAGGSVDAVQQDESEDSYLPIGGDPVRTYNIIETRFGDASPRGQISLRYLPPRDLNGTRVVPGLWEEDGHTTYEFLVSDTDGVYTFATQDPDDVTPEIHTPLTYLLKYPLVVGTT